MRVLFTSKFSLIILLLIYKSPLFRSSTISQATKPCVTAVFIFLYPGIKDASTTNPVTTLADLGLDSLMGVEVKQMLERDYDLVLPMKEIRRLTMNKLNDIMSGSVAEDTSKDATQLMNYSGVSVRYDLSRVMPTETIVPMNDQPTDAASRPWFVVHSIEGVVLSLESVMLQVRTPVYGLQCTADAPLTSVEDLAAFYIQVSVEIASLFCFCCSDLLNYGNSFCMLNEMFLFDLVVNETIETIIKPIRSPILLTIHCAHCKVPICPGKQVFSVYGYNGNDGMAQEAVFP